jgi:hypothetical protein
MSENSNNDAEGKKVFRVIVAGLVLVASAIVAGVFVYFLALDIAYAQPWMMEVFKEHTAAVLGLPLAAIAALALVLALETKSGRIEFEGFGFKFRGASGEVIMWVICFLAMASSIKLLW